MTSRAGGRVSAGGENGITLVELLVTIVIMGVVATGIAALFSQAVTVEPTTRDRSKFSGDSAFLVNSVSNDIANATDVTHTPTLTCTPGPQDVVTITLVGSGGTVHYRAVVATAEAVAGSRAYRVDISRQENTDDAQTLLTGYCIRGTTFGEASYHDPTYSLDLSLRVSPEADTRQLSIGGAKRTNPVTPMTLSGKVTNEAGWALPGWQITVWSLSDPVTPVRTLETLGDGRYSTFVVPGTYRVCQQRLPVGWTPVTPAFPATTYSFAGCPSPDAFPTSSVGYEVSATNVDLDFKDGYEAGGFNCDDQSIKETFTNNPWWPGNAGPDYVVRTYAPYNHKIQSALDTSKQADAPMQGDINRDGLVLVAVLSNAVGGGHTDETVTINGRYAANGKRFALVGCAGGVRSTNASPAITVTSDATAVDTRINEAAWDQRANIVIINMEAANSPTGVQVNGSGRLLRTVKGQDNTGPGIQIAGDENTIYGGEADGNTGSNGNGVTITGHRNRVTQSFDAYDNAKDGIHAEGNDNRFDDVQIGTSGKGNRDDGLEVVGDRSALDQVTSEDNDGAGIRITGHSSRITRSRVGANNKGNGATGITMTGNNSTLDDVTAFENTGIGIRISGNSNTVEDSEVDGDNGTTTANGVDISGTSNTVRRVTATSNRAVGVRVAGNGNTIEYSTANSNGPAVTAHGFEVSGNSNTLTELESIGNGGNGFVVSGGTAAAPNALRNNRSNTGNPGSSKENGGYEYRLAGYIVNRSGNKADNRDVPTATKCPSPTFPASSAGPPGVHVTPPGEGLCE